MKLVLIRTFTCGDTRGGAGCVPIVAVARAIRTAFGELTIL
jgi:hypothetical protein